MSTAAALPATDYDVIICGAGPVGLSLATLLHDHARAAARPLRVALIDAKPAASAQQDPRTIALSYGSQQILQQLGAWRALSTDASAIHEIHVSRRQHFGRTLIRHSDYHLPALGHVVRYGPLVTALGNLLPAASSTAAQTLSVLRPAQVSAIEEQTQQVSVTLADGRTLSSGIVAQAEGGVFSEQHAKSLQRDYNQVALIAHVTSSHAMLHRAFERFTAEGPLALLPQDNGYALVWCVRPATAEHLLQLDDNAFLTELGRAFGGRVGRFVTASPRHSYPLGLNAAATANASARCVAIGNAAQTLHPVAGQGLNLGLRDAVVLADAVRRHGPHPAALAHFNQHRQHDRNTTIRLTDTMARVFASAPDGAPLQTLLGLSLGLIDVAAPLKRLLAEQMMFGSR